jgi:hypothetical protein
MDQLWRTLYIAFRRLYLLRSNIPHQLQRFTLDRAADRESSQQQQITQIMPTFQMLMQNKLFNVLIWRNR